MGQLFRIAGLVGAMAGPEWVRKWKEVVERGM